MGEIEYYCQDCGDELPSDRIKMCCRHATDDCPCQGMPEVEELCESCEKIKDALEELGKVKPCSDCINNGDSAECSGCVFEIENFFKKA